MSVSTRRARSRGGNTFAFAGLAYRQLAATDFRCAANVASPTRSATWARRPDRNPRGTFPARALPRYGRSRARSRSFGSVKGDLGVARLERGPRRRLLGVEPRGERPPRGALRRGADDPCARKTRDGLAAKIPRKDEPKKGEGSRLARGFHAGPLHGRTLRTSASRSKSCTFLERRGGVPSRLLDDPRRPERQRPRCEIGPRACARPGTRPACALRAALQKRADLDV